MSNTFPSVGHLNFKESNYADHGVRKYDDEIGRFTSIDPLWEKYYSLTPYQYAGNNPVSQYDENGKWSSSFLFGNLHASIINQATNGMGINEKLVDILITGENSVDDDQDNQYLHAMRSPGQTIEEAQELMENFINENLEKFYNTENDEEAYRYLGLATHPISDNECEGHKGFQVYNGFSLGHFFKDIDEESQGYKNAVKRVRIFIKKARDERNKRLLEKFEERVRAYMQSQELNEEQ